MNLLNEVDRGFTYEPTSTGVIIKLGEPAVQPGQGPAAVANPSGGTAQQVVPSSMPLPGNPPRSRPAPPVQMTAPAPAGQDAPIPGNPPRPRPTPTSQAPAMPGTEGGGGILQSIMAAMGGGGGEVDPNNDPRGMIARALGIPVGVSNTVHDAMSGMAAVDPTQPGLTAFAQGFGNAGAYRGQRLDKKREELAAAQAAEYERAWNEDERAYDRGRDKVEDAREAKKLTMDERKAMFDELSDRLGNLKTAAEIRKIAREAEGKGLTADQVLRREERVSAAVRARFGSDPAMSGATAEDIKAFEDAYRTQIDSYLDEAIGGGTAAPAGGAPADIPMPEIGSGTYEAPFNFDGMDPGAMSQSFEALPPGSYFVNPADGSIRVKQ